MTGWPAVWLANARIIAGEVHSCDGNNIATVDGDKRLRLNWKKMRKK